MYDQLPPRIYRSIYDLHEVWNGQTHGIGRSVVRNCQLAARQYQHDNYLAQAHQRLPHSFLAYRDHTAHILRIIIETGMPIRSHAVVKPTRHVTV